jgi:hypothetical protein
MTMEMYHVTTEKKAKIYRITGYIKKPVRGFTTLQGAMAWAIKVGRKVIYLVKSDTCYKLPDHHNRFGEAWWSDEDIPIDRCTCVFSADKDA